MLMCMSHWFCSASHKIYFISVLYALCISWVALELNFVCFDAVAEFYCVFVSPLPSLPPTVTGVKYLEMTETFTRLDAHKTVTLLCK